MPDEPRPEVPQDYDEGDEIPAPMDDYDLIDSPDPYGTYAPKRPRHVLHSEVVEIRTADLPRRFMVSFDPLDLDDIDDSDEPDKED